MTAIQKFLLFAFGILITVGFIGYGMGFYGKSANFGKEADTSLNELATTLTNTRFTEYNNTSVSGTQVINGIRLYASPSITVYVKTKASSEYNAYNDSGSYTITDIGNSDYIEPTGVFFAEVERTANDTVDTLRFTQQ